MSFGKYKNFQDCVADNQDKENPEGYCKALEEQIVEKAETYLGGPIVMKQGLRKIATAPVLVPYESDSDGESVTPDKIEDVALKFMEDYQLVDGMHTFNKVAQVVESWLERNDTEYELATGDVLQIPKGTWMMSVKVSDDGVWQDILDGKLRGLSIAAIREADLARVNKSQNPRVELGRLLRRTLLSDLGKDWFAAAVSIVDDPAVLKSKWIALKFKEPKSALGKLWDFVSKSKEDEMDEKEVGALIDEKLTTALEPFQGLSELTGQLQEIGTAVKSFDTRIGTVETALKEKAEGDEGEDEGGVTPPPDGKEDDTIEALTTEVTAMKSIIEKTLELVTKGRALDFSAVATKKADEIVVPEDVDWRGCKTGGVK